MEWWAMVEGLFEFCKAMKSQGAEKSILGKGLFTVVATATKR
jgi:hypothetical protein